VLALQYHPDRPGTDKAEQTNRFQEINEAYGIVMAHIDAGGCGMDPTEHNTEPPSVSSTSYAKVLGRFVSFVVGKWSSVEDTVDRLFGRMSNGGHGDVFIRTFDMKHITLLLAVIRDNEAMVATTLDIDVSLVRRLDELIRRRMERVNEKSEENTEPTPSPHHHNVDVSVDVSVDDCLEARVIEVKYGSTTLYVPSWQYIVSFEVGDDETVSFESKISLDRTMDVDEENNLIVGVSVGLKELMDMEYIGVPVGGTMFQVPVNELKVMRTQRYVFEGRGIPRICEHDIYRCHERADVVVSKLMEHESLTHHTRDMDDIAKSISHAVGLAHPFLRHHLTKWM
jgi:hypothetical protein